jgi:hypothetical protein
MSICERHMTRWTRVPIAFGFLFSRRLSASWAVFVLAAALSGCAAARPPATPPVVSALGPWERIGSDPALPDERQGYVRAGDTVRLAAAVNSVAALQLQLSAPDKPATGVEISADPFTPADEPSTPHGKTIGLQPTAFPISLYRMWPVTVDRYPTWYLRSVGPHQRRQFFDAMVPIDAPRHGQPFTLAAGDRIALWVEIRIPRSAMPGRYRTTLTVREGHGQSSRLPIELWVRDVFLRPETSLPVLAGVQLSPVLEAHTRHAPNNLRAALADADARRVLTSAFTLLHDHGLSPFTSEVHPQLSQDIDGKVRVDWTAYDAFCGPLIDGSAYDDCRPAAGWPLPVDMAQPDPVQYDGIASPAYAAVLTQYLDAVRSHFNEKGWLRRAWVWFNLARDPQPASDEIERFRRVASLMRGPATMPASAPETPHPPLVSTLIPQSMTPFGWANFRPIDVADDVGIWATPARYQHRPALDRSRSAGQRTWLAPDQPPFAGSLAVVAPPVHPRSLPWQAFLQGSDALILRKTTDWPDKPFDEPIRDSAQPSDTSLLYPGEFFGLKAPIASVRLKRLQLGLQDYQLLRLLEEQGHGETARLLAGSLIKAWGSEAYGDNFLDGLFGRRTDDPGVWQLAHDLLLDEAAAAVTDPPGRLHDPAANRDAWARFLSATRRIEVTPESSRVTVLLPTADDDSAGPMTRAQRMLTVTHDVAVRSEMRTELHGDLRLGPLPPGGRSVTDLVPVGPLAEMGLARRRLAWELDGPLPCNLDGHYLQRIRLDAAAAGEVEVDAALSIVQAPPAGRPIAVDGNLSDWLPGEHNTAGDFRLICSGRAFPPAKPASSGPRPQASSLAAADRPAALSQTVAYFCRDAATLYIAVHAATPAVADRTAAWEQSGGWDRSPDRSGTPPQSITSDISYDGLFPVGDDLVEVLIDPTNRGTLSDDLYHIVIKSNGIAVFERGLGMSPAIGRVQPWPGPPPRHAVVRTDFGWSAEIAIPLAALNPPPLSKGRAGVGSDVAQPPSAVVGSHVAQPPEPSPLGKGLRGDRVGSPEWAGSDVAQPPAAVTVWGLNITRLEPIRGEYSDWARAPRYCYDPRTLGNLLWPE